MINHNKTNIHFKNFVDKRPNELFLHDSRNENWLSILESGLLRLANAIITGKVFGYGLYYSDKVKKSISYTS